MNSCWPSGPPAIGQTAELSRAVAPDDIERFTQISGDRNPLHYNPAAARASRFGEIIVQGGITSALQATPRRRIATVRSLLTSEGHWFELSCAHQENVWLDRLKTAVDHEG